MDEILGPPVDWAAYTTLFGGSEDLGRQFCHRFVELAWSEVRAYDAP